MARIPKGVKKQIRGQFKRAARESGVAQAKRTWTHAVGDLVYHTSDKVWGIVTEHTDGNGWLTILTPNGSCSVHASRVDRVQEKS